MKKYITDTKELVGKTIESVYFVDDDARLVVKYTNGTCSVIGSTSFDAEIELEDGGGIHPIDKFNWGIITSEEFEVIRKQEKEAREARVIAIAEQRESGERAQLAVLKEKYEMNQ